MKITLPPSPTNRLVTYRLTGRALAPTDQVEGALAHTPTRNTPSGAARAALDSHSHHVPAPVSGAITAL